MTVVSGVAVDGQACRSQGALMRTGGRIRYGRFVQMEDLGWLFVIVSIGLICIRCRMSEGRLVWIE